MSNTFIVSAARTPVTSFQGTLSAVRSPDLGGAAIRAAVERAKISPDKIEMCIMGCVLPAGLGQSPARQAIFSAGLPKEVNALTVNKVCSSGLVAVMLADQIIRAGEANVVVAGGMESMTNSPYTLPNGRAGYRMGDGKVVDTMVNDGLWDIYTNQHMGACAELCAKTHGVTRKEQDDFATESYKKALAAIEAGHFKDEIVAVEIKSKSPLPPFAKGGSGGIFVDKDEEPAKVRFEKFPTLPTPFAKDGTVTPANASSISDGAAAVVVMSDAHIKELGATPMARIISHATFSREPEWFTMAPVGAIKRALEKAKLTIADIDLFEVNEAFSVVTLMAIRELKLDPKKVNISGGAVALGHPIGASGARILTTLLYNMKRTGAKRGLATLCNGGGEATALIVERM